MITKNQNALHLNNPETGKEVPKNETSDLFNDFFCSVAGHIQESIIKLPPAEKKTLNEAQTNYLKHNDHHNTYQNQTQNQLSEFNFRDVSNNEVKLLFKKIENHKSSGVHGLTSSIFKITAKILVPQFKFLFNLCLRTASFPDSWKTTIVTPLFKSGDSKSPGNYRPIACIPLPGKLLEKLIHAQLYNFLESNHLLNNAQYGFRSSRNTHLAIFAFLDNIHKNLNSNTDTIVTYVDFRKAFDTVDHHTRLNKLKDLKLSSKSISLFKNYLTHRAQHVFTNKKLSSSHSIKTGVPQGSTLGPLLFVIYINSLPTIFKDSKAILFADDTVILHPTKNFETSYNLIQNDLNLLHLWCRSNLLEVNANKTKVMFFT